MVNIKDTNIKVDPVKLRAYADRLNKVRSRLNTLQSRAAKLARSSGNAELTKLANQDFIGENADDVAKYEAWCRQTAQNFDNLERNIKNWDSSNYTVYDELVINNPEGIIGVGKAIVKESFFGAVGGMLLDDDAVRTKTWSEVHTHTEDLDENGYGETRDSYINKHTREGGISGGKNGDVWKDKSAIYKRSPGGEDDNLGSKSWGVDRSKDENKLAKKKSTIVEAGYHQSAEVTAYEDGTSVTGKNGSASANVKVGNAEAHFDAYAGLYGYDANGKKFISPAVHAEIGASVTALHADADGELHVGLPDGKMQEILGDDFKLAGAQGEVSCDVGKAEAKASADFALKDKNGNWNPQLDAKLSAEAVAVSVEGKAGVTVLGTEANVTGALKIGIGAHADVGYKDGKLSCNIGASLGIGVDVGFEVDVKGTVKAVTNAVSAGEKAIRKGAKKIVSGFKKLKFW